jgi:hypothetical protein
MSSLLSLVLRPAPALTSLYFYSSSGTDFGKGKPVQGAVRAAFGLGAKMTSSFFESAETIAHMGKATTLAASSAFCFLGLNNMCEAFNKKSTSMALKGAAQLMIGGVASALAAQSDSGVVSNLQNSLSIAGISAAIFCEGALGLYKGDSWLARLSIGALGLGWALTATRP